MNIDKITATAEEYLSNQTDDDYIQYCELENDYMENEKEVKSGDVLFGKQKYERILTITIIMF